MNFSYKIVPTTEYCFSGNQEIRAEQIGATHILYWPRDSRGKLPKYVETDLSDRGLRAQKIGGTTFKNTVFGLIPINQ